MTSVIVFFLLHGFTLSTWFSSFLSLRPVISVITSFISLLRILASLVFPLHTSVSFCLASSTRLLPFCSVPPSFSASSPSLHFNTSPFPLTSLISMRSCFPLKQLPPRSVFGFIPFLLPLIFPFLSFIYVSSVPPFPSSLPFLHPFLSSPFTPHSFISILPPPLIFPYMFLPSVFFCLISFPNCPHLSSHLPQLPPHSVLPFLHVSGLLPLFFSPLPFMVPSLPRSLRRTTFSIFYF